MHPLLRSAAVALIALGPPALRCRADGSAPLDWPAWRGPRADGIADGRKLPLHWTQTNNVIWSVTLPGWGTSSPVVRGNRVFVTTAAEDGGRKSLLTLCFSRDDGRELWRHDFGLGANQKTHVKSNSRVEHARGDGRCVVRGVRQRGPRSLLA